MKTLNVDLAERSYPVLIGRDLLAQPGVLAPYIRSEQVLVVSNDTVAPLYLDKMLALLGGIKADSLILADGEQYKTLDTLKLIFDFLLTRKHHRATTLIALGGGVIGDMTGFAAACYQRGVDFIQAPTTLLAQVDSSVGGKTGVNHPLGKNMIGAFHQPRCVLADTATLVTLSAREFSAGLAEVIKYGLIADAEFLTWLEVNIGALIAREHDALIHAIERSCSLKSRIVSLDECEGGIRAILNFGHTFGHAIETSQGYGNWLHGEAIAAGMVIAAELSARQGWINDAEVGRIVALLERAGLPTAAPHGLSVEEFIERMSVDKKAVNGIMRLVLLRGVGDAVITTDYDPAQLEDVLATRG
ncbi:MAG: 3-dehydroquinate synthase [Porticoccaceae bacterium]